MSVLLYLIHLMVLKKTPSTLFLSSASSPRFFTVLLGTFAVPHSLRLCLRSCVLSHHCLFAICADQWASSHRPNCSIQHCSLPRQIRIYFIPAEYLSTYITYIHSCFKSFFSSASSVCISASIASIFPIITSVGSYWTASYTISLYLLMERS